MKKLFALLTLALLTGCVGPSVIEPPVGDQRKVHIDERLMQPCQQLTNLKDNPKPTDVLEQHGADVADYKDCSESKQKLIEVVKKAFE